jgi:hypothetical protein
MKALRPLFNFNWNDDSMSIAWKYSPETKTNIKPAIQDQLIDIDCNVLTLRNPWIGDSVFMAKMYISMTLLLIAVVTYLFLRSGVHSEEFILYAIFMAFPAFIALLVWYRIFLIRRLSNFFFNRRTKKIFYKRNKMLFEFDWAQTEGGVFVRNEFGGAGFTTNFALAFGPKPTACQERDRIVLWVNSNHSNDPDPRYVAQVWEYIRQFMEEGPKKLPEPGEPNWWYAPLHRICLTPVEAWRHYAPWRTGEPGEMQGKKNWLLPLWLVLFPYNLFSALCWYVVCRVFNVRGAPPPPEALRH